MTPHTARNVAVARAAPRPERRAERCQTRQQEGLTLQPPSPKLPGMWSVAAIEAPFALPINDLLPRVNQKTPRASRSQFGTPHQAPLCRDRRLPGRFELIVSRRHVITPARKVKNAVA
jgi:hypothetical protein